MSQIIDLSSKITSLSQDNGYGTTKIFKPVRSDLVVSQFEAEGYKVESVLDAKVKDSRKQGYQKHLIRMSHPDITCKINGLRPEIIFKTANDGTTQNEIFMGIYRFLCANGLEAGTDFERIKVKHVGDNVFGRVLDACLKVRQSFPQLVDKIQQMQGRTLSQNEISEFARRMGKWLVSHRDNVTQVDASSLLTLRRQGDKSPDLFTILNVIQENSLSGSYRYVSSVNDKDNEGQKILKLRSGQKAKGLDRKSQINTAVWDMASQFLAS